MILAAGLLVLLGLVLFVAGVLSGVTALYWACVAGCLVAAALLVLVWRRMAAQRAAGGPRGGPTTSDVAGRAPVREAEADAGSATGSVPPAGQAPGHTGDAGAALEVARSAGDGVPAGNGAAGGRGLPDAATAAVPEEAGEPPVEDVEVTDLLLVVDLADEVLVVDEHPRYHLAGCLHLTGRETIPLPVDEARTDGFTPCGVCRPDRSLAERERARRQATES